MTDFWQVDLTTLDHQEECRSHERRKSERHEGVNEELGMRLRAISHFCAGLGRGNPLIFPSQSTDTIIEALVVFVVVVVRASLCQSVWWWDRQPQQ
jgi:hypothetical protein